jgi:tryptophan-rich sensory protein
MDMDSSSQGRAPLPQRWAAVILPVAAVALLAPVATRPNIPGWYDGLAKPPLTPPNWLFAPVWTALFLAMAYAAFRVLSRPAGTPARTWALRAFFVQLALNGLWSWTFFAGRSPGAGLLVIAALLGAVLLTTRLFWQVDRTAGWLLVPYVAWGAYATYLNFGVWRLNG